MNIGLWTPHSQTTLCPGNFGTPTTQTRMHYTTSERPDVPYIVGGCLSTLVAGNNALSSFQNAQLAIPFTMISAGHIQVTLSVGGTYSFMPSVQVNGTTYLTSSGSANVAVSAGANTLNFSINPVAPGTVPADGISITAILAF